MPYMCALVHGYFEKLSFRPISSLSEKFYPRNINYIPVVKFSRQLDIELKSLFLKVPSSMHDIPDLHYTQRGRVPEITIFSDKLLVVMLHLEPVTQGFW